MRNFVKRFEEQVVKSWDLPALGDYRAKPMSYQALASQIEILHILFSESGLVAGDKIAINAASSAAWGEVFMATTTLLLIS